MDTNAQLARADEELINSLSSLASSLQQGGDLGENVPTISGTDTLFYNLRWYLVSNLRQLLSQLYVEHGIVQTLIDQPVDDGYRAGFEIKTNNLSEDEKDELIIYEQRNNVIASLIQAIKWARLYGGGAVLIITDQDPKTPFNIAKIGKDTPLEFRAVDMWELYFAQQNTTGTMEEGGALGNNQGDFYDYYGQQVHKSRVYKIEGKAPPSFIKPRLRGWGMSELERLVRSMNQYLKNQDVIFELLDEAKVDAYKIKGFNSALMNAGGTDKVSQRVQMSNQIKNYQNAIVMDAEDDYIQKQINFSGLNDILLQIRQGLAADLHMPMTKLFGISAAGFNSGEDDIENYNSMIDGEIRSKTKFMVVDLLQICCQKLFGTTIPDLMIEFNPLRMLSSKEQEEVKDSKFNRVMNAYQSGVANYEQTAEAINADSLLGVELDPKGEPSPPMQGDMANPVTPAQGNIGKQAKEPSK